MTERPESDTADVPRFDFTAPVPPVGALGPTHFIAIGGSGMSGIAHLYLQAGVEVSGSDAKDSATLRALAAAGARVHVGHDPGHLPPVGTVVVSSAIRPDNPELGAARAAGLRVLHRAQGLAALLAGRRPAAVAGANGKTTTSAMLTVGLQSAGCAPGFVIGSPIGGQGVSSAPGAGTDFVVEADESDGSFLSYRPEVAVVTNVRPDHLDHYGTYAAIEEAYDAFARTIRPKGLLVVCQDDPGAARLGERHRARGARVLSYGVSADADVRITEVATHGLRTTATLIDRPAPPSDTEANAESGREPDAGTESRAVSVRHLEVPMAGLHNLANATGAYVAAVHGLGADPDAFLAGVAEFGGTDRRFQPVGEIGGVRIIDDYAHNPDKVAAVVAAGRSVVADSGRLVVLFQPHLYSRTRDFAAEFADGLSGADLVVVTEVFAAREDPIPGVSGELIVQALLARPDAPQQVLWLPQRVQAAACLADLVRAGDLVLTVGAGDVTTVGPELLALLSADAPGGPE